MQDRFTKKEAMNALEFGTIVWENPEEYFQMLKDNGIYDGETLKQARENQLRDISVVNYEDHEYLIGVEEI